MSTNTPTLNLCGVFSETKRIINAHSRHFLALTVLFLLPLSFSLIIYPTLKTTLFQSNSIIFHPHPSHLFLPHPNPTSKPRTPLILPLLYTVFITLLAVCAVATISYSTFHGFYGRPVKLVSSIRSILYTFLPLVATLIVSQVLVVLAALIPALFLAFAFKGLALLGFEIDLDSDYFDWFVIFVGIVIGMFLIWVQVNWSLVFVIVVLESKWGFEPLRRSAYLVKGMRGVALCLLLFSGCVIGFLLWGGSGDMAEAYGWRRWAFILQTVFSSGFITMFMLQNLAATVVLYMYCKALHGELAFEIAEEFSYEYVSLPFDSEKLPHVIYVVPN